MSAPDSSFNAYGPNQYAVTSGSSTTHNESFNLPTGAAAPYRVYVVNGAADGTLRVTSGSVTLNGTQIVTTTELTSSVGSLTKVVTLNASNTLGITVSGSVDRHITVRRTATDTTKPTLTISAPAPNALSNSSSVAVSGTISDQTTTTVTVNGTAASGRHTDSTRTVIRDTQAPSLAVSAPADGAITREATIQVSATAADANGVTVNTNGTPLTGSGGSFSGAVALAQGSTVLTTTATDGAGNTNGVVRTVTRDTVPPALVVGAPADQLTVIADSVTVSGTVSDLTSVTLTINGAPTTVSSGAFTRKVALVEGPNSIQVVATDAATNQTSVTRTVTRQPPPPPPDPSTVAPPLDQTVATSVGASTEFLYSGADPIQTGVVAGTMSPLRAALIRGRVLKLSADTLAPLPNARVTVLNHPELGMTRSRADGRYDLVANGGGYDDADRVTRRVLPGGRVVLFAYDSSGNLTSLTPSGRPAHTFRYTAIDGDSLYTPPALGSGPWATEYRYNVDRQLTEVRRPDSLTIAFGYDTAGRPSTVTFDRGQLGFTYSSTTGHLTTITAPGGSTLSFTYDGVLPKTVTWGGTVTGSLGVGYNTDFRVISQTVNGANSVSFAYDQDGLLKTAGALGLKRHAQTGFVERDSVGSVLGVWTYDPKGALAGYTASTSGTPVFQTSYVRDSLSRLTQVTETVQGTTTTVAFAYDSASRLFEVRRNGTLTATYEYDANGNRLQLTTPSGTVTGSYDDQDRLTSYGTTTYAYTRAGGLRWKAVGNDTTSYTYDALGNLTGVTLPGGTAITYVIDGQNRRVGKQVNGVLVQGLLYQGRLAPVAELNGNGQVVGRFVYATRVNVPDYIVKADTTYRLVLDHLGSVRLVVNTQTDSVVQRLDYDEFGRVTQNSNPGFQPFGYAGGLLDEHTGLVRFGARDYDAETGRWTAKDPIGFAAGSPNLYTYVDGEPINRYDPNGLEVIVTIWQPVGWGKSSFGHVSVDVNGKTYSLGEGAYWTGSTKEYLRRNNFREGLGLKLKLTPQQERQLEEILKRSQGDWTPFTNNCTDPVERALEELGQKLGPNLFPAALGNSLIDAGLVDEVIMYPATNPGSGRSAPWAK